MNDQYQYAWFCQIGLDSDTWVWQVRRAKILYSSSLGSPSGTFPLLPIVFYSDCSADSLFLIAWPTDNFTQHSVGLTCLKRIRLSENCAGSLLLDLENTGRILSKELKLIVWLLPKKTKYDNDLVFVDKSCIRN